MSSCKGHLATRRAAGLFDFSFMGLYEFPDRHSVQPFQSRNLEALAPGQLAYSLLLNQDGSVFNDATVWRLPDDRYWLFTGRRSDFERFRGSAHDRSGELAILALQGPASGEILARLVGRETVLTLKYFHYLQRGAMWIARLGYSGELGYELLVPAAESAQLREKLLDAGRVRGVRECSFATADSLRVESGYILFSKELTAAADPFELGLGRLVTGRGFIGAEALARKRLAGPRRRLVGLLPTGAMRVAGRLPEARMTSETWSPVFGRQLGMGFAPAEHAAAGTLLRLADGRLARCARLPFYDPARVLPRRLCL